MIPLTCGLMEECHTVKKHELHLSVSKWQKYFIWMISSIFSTTVVHVRKQIILLPNHWGSSHEGSGRHPRQHGGGRGRRFGKFTANSHRVCSLLRPSFCELWETLTRNPELQWSGISPQFRLKVSRGDEGVGDVCFPVDEGVGRPWRGYRCVQMNVGPA